MKKLLLLCLFLALSSVYAQKPMAANVNKAVKVFGRCSGDEYCTACTNCSACKHCSKEGGSCGVCAPKSKPVAEAKPAKVASVAPAAPRVKKAKQYKPSQMLEVTSETLKLRSGPGPDYDVIEELTVGDMATDIETDGEWPRVRVDVTGHIGYLKSQFVK